MVLGTNDDDLGETYNGLDNEMEHPLTRPTRLYDKRSSFNLELCSYGM